MLFVTSKGHGIRLLVVAGNRNHIMTKKTILPKKKPPRGKYKWTLLGLLCVAFFFHQGDRAIYGVVATEIEADLNLTKSDIGLVAAILFWTIALMTPVAGYLGDVFRKKVMITGALIFWSLTTTLTALSRGVFSLAMLRSVATGGSESFYAPPAYALLANFHKKTRAMAMSIHQAALYLGIMTSGFFGGFIAKQWGWRSVFFVYGGVGIIIGALFIYLLKDERDFADEDGEEQAETKPVWENPLHSLSIIFRKPTSLLLTIGFTAIVYVNNAYLTFAPGFLEEKFDISREQAGTYAMFYHHAAALVGVLIGGRLSDKLASKVVGGRLRIQMVTMFLGAAAIVYMSLGNTLVAACVGMTVFGFFRGLYESNTHASLFDVIEPKYRSSAVGAMVMFAFLIGATAPWLMGVLADSGKTLSSIFASYALAYVIGGFAVAIALIFFFKKDRIIEELD